MELSIKLKKRQKKIRVALLVQQEPTKVLTIEGETQDITDSAKKSLIIQQYLEIANKSNPESIHWPSYFKTPYRGRLCILGDYGY